MIQVQVYDSSARPLSTVHLQETVDKQTNSSELDELQILGSCISCHMFCEKGKGRPILRGTSTRTAKKNDKT